MSVSRGMGDVALAKGLYKDALLHYREAERILRVLSEAPYGASGLPANTPAATAPKNAGTRRRGNDVARLRASGPADACLTPGSRARINPYLGSSLSSLMAVRLWVQVLLGEPVDNAAVEVYS